MTDTTNETHDASPSKATGQAIDERKPRCCGPVVQASCCESQAKPVCCGDVASGTCACA
jgi:hypothetical protein